MIKSIIVSRLPTLTTNLSFSSKFFRMAAKITPEEWEMHKETILGMRRSGLRVRGKGGIVDMMKTGHGFTAR